jgi:hypothetical protein
MADKFDKMSIYDTEWKSLDNEGVEQAYTFRPLPFKYYPKTYDLLNKLQELKVDESLSEQEREKAFLEKMNSDVIALLMELEKAMVKKSYPDLSEEKIELFVTSNVFLLMEPLLKLISRQEVIDPRHVTAAQK